MAVAAAYRIPRSQLLGREPAQITEYEDDEQGRLVRSVTTWEPRWTPEDMAWALAWMAEQADRCPGCRMALAETTAMRDGEAVHTYTVDLPRVCRACEAIAKGQDAYAKKFEDRYSNAKIWTAVQDD